MSAPDIDGQMTILLVEDHEDTRKITATMIQARGFDVVTAASVQDALLVAKEENIDFVIADIGLPDGNGYDLMKQLTEQFGINGIALTAHGLQADKQRAACCGFLQHYTKPISASILDSMLEVARAVFRGR